MLAYMLASVTAFMAPAMHSSRTLATPFQESTIDCIYHMQINGTDRVPVQFSDCV